MACRADEACLLEGLGQVRQLAGLYAAGYGTPRNGKVRELGERIEYLAEEMTGDRT